LVKTKNMGNYALAMTVADSAVQGSTLVLAAVHLYTVRYSMVATVVVAAIHENAAHLPLTSNRLPKRRSDSI
jgi:hypothetical protein